MTQRPVLQAASRVELLIEELTKAHERVLIPCPALAEFLVLAAEAGPRYLAELRNQPSFYLQPFDERAAIETAAIELLARQRGSRRGSAREDAPWQKVKFDRQILAIAKMRLAHTLYTDDTNLTALAGDVQLKVVHTWQLALPESEAPLLDGNGEPLDIR